MVTEIQSIHLEVQVILGIWLDYIGSTSKMVQTDEKVYDSKNFIRLAKKDNANCSIYNPFHETLFDNSLAIGLFNLSISGNLRGLEGTTINYYIKSSFIKKF